MSYGKIAYEAYCQQSDFRSLISGQSLPTWEAQAPEIQAAWNVAAAAVLDAEKGATA